LLANPMEKRNRDPHQVMFISIPITCYHKEHIGIFEIIGKMLCD